MKEEDYFKFWPLYKHSVWACLTCLFYKDFYFEWWMDLRDFFKGFFILLGKIMITITSPVVSVWIAIALKKSNISFREERQIRSERRKWGNNYANVAQHREE